MTPTEHDSKRPMKGSRLLRWLAILSLTGLFSILVTPLGTSAAGPYTITLTPGHTEKAIGNTATLTAQLSPADASVSVHFAITGVNSAKSGNATTDGTGKAEFTYTGNNYGVDTVVATVSPDSSSSVTVDWAALVVTPSNQTVTTAKKASLTMTIYNPGNDGVANKTIHYTITNSNGNIPTLTGTVQAGSNGVANFIYPRSDAAAGTTDTITTWADVNGGGTQTNPDPTGNEVTVHWGTYNVDITSAPTKADIDSNVSVVATVTDQNDDPVSGVGVRFIVTGENPTSGVATTNSNGEATFTYSGDTLGTDTVRAFVDLNGDTGYDSGEPYDTTTIDWIDITFTLSPSSQSASLGEQVSIDASVTSPSGSVNNLRIRYKVTGANPKTSSVLTDGNGDATIAYTGTHSGTDTVTAYVDLNNNNVQDSGEPSDTATVDWSTADLNLTPSSQTVTTNTSASLTASLTNSNVDVEGVVIRYSVTGANSTSGTATTDSNGDATISYTGTNAGADTVTAYADYNNNGSQDSGEPSVTATVTWTLTASLSLSPTTTTPGVGSTSYTAVALTTSNGGVPGVVVHYSVSGANSASGTMTTDGSGNTVISYTGNNSGTDTLTAYADMNNNGSQDSGEPTASVTITWGGGGTTPPPPPSTFAPAQPAAQKSGCTYFPATQHNLCAGFLAYWNQFGGVNIFGMPVTEEFQENGVTVQYFERARFEWHPGAWPAHYDVLLGLLGDEVTAGRTDAPFQATTASSSSDCTYFAQTGHNLCGTFKQYWEQFGDLASYGFPISEAFQEKNPDTGQVYTVQYFERARFELQPGAWPAHLNVLLGRLGAQVLAMKYGAELY